MSSVSKLIKVLFVVVVLSIWPLVFVMSNKWQAPISIFHFEYQDVQLIIRKTYLYPTVLMARIFQNKTQIPITKFEHNLTALLDPNNYFFGYHPREIFGGTNAVKFPVYSLPYFLFGIYYLINSKKYKAFLLPLLVCLILLSFIKNYASFDFVLYFPLSLILITGMRKIPNQFRRIERYYLLVALPLSAIELVRQFILLYRQ